MRKMAAILLSMTLLLSACGGNGGTATTAAPETTKAETTAAETTAAQTTAAETAGQEGAYKPGTYTASAQGNNGPVTLSVTFSESGQRTSAILLSPLLKS